MPELPYQIITVGTNILILIFMIYYIWRLHTKEVELDRKSHKVDTDYHAVVDNALTKERKILDDAAKEATQIISGAHYINETTKASIDQTLQKMVQEVHTTASSSSHQFLEFYQNSLKQISVNSLTDFQSIIRGLEGDYQKQLEEFQKSVLPNMEKEIEAYKQARFKEAEALVTKIVQKVSQEVLNKALTLDDHEKLVIDALEKAKKEGVF